MASFQVALQLGADGIGLDVQCSPDGGLFVVHDYKVDRTTDGSGLVSSLQSDTLATLDVGSWFIGAAFEMDLLGEVGHGLPPSKLDAAQ